MPMSDNLLREMIEAIERIRRDYPDVPVRFEFAPDVYAELRRQIPSAMSVSHHLTSSFYSGGIPCVEDLRSAPGEWGPVFRTTSRSGGPR
jgi:hypothetical protein